MLRIPGAADLDEHNVETKKGPQPVGSADNATAATTAAAADAAAGDVAVADIATAAADTAAPAGVGVALKRSRGDLVPERERRERESVCVCVCV